MNHANVVGLETGIHEVEFMGAYELEFEGFPVPVNFVQRMAEAGEPGRRAGPNPCRC
jgi:hypothetical protein